MKLIFILHFLIFLLIVGCSFTDKVVNPDSFKIYSLKRINPKDGSNMVLIRNHTFYMGSDVSESGRLNDEALHKVELSSFNISDREISIKQYVKFLNDFSGGPLHYSSLMSNSALCGITKENGIFKVKDNRHDYPVVFVNHKNAMAYAQWAGGNLPTEAQWESSSGGRFDRKYPWGNEIPQDGVNCSFGGATNKTGAYKQSDEIFDMGGNVREWCREGYRGDYYSVSPLLNPQNLDATSNKVVRGGSFLTSPEKLRVSSRDYEVNLTREADIGFRIVMEIIE